MINCTDQQIYKPFHSLSLMMNTSMALKNKVILVWVFVVFINVISTNAHVEIGAYNDTCPNAEAIVQQEMASILKADPTLAGALLRMHFADCFVQGCDASILLNARNESEFVEKDSFVMFGIRGFDVVDRIKAELEKACPGIVSCADIITLAARESVAFTGGPRYAIPTGRRDGNRSLSSDIPAQLPPPTANISQLKTFFLQKNLTVKDLVVLSGAHTIGRAHCASFSNRLYNNTDNSLDKSYAATLKNTCKPNDLNTTVEMDPGSSKTFDTSYYNQVAKHRGLFTSDDALLYDQETRAYVESHTNATKDEFFKDFEDSMVVMGKIGVLTHQKGEIRKNCGFRN